MKLWRHGGFDVEVDYKTKQQQLLTSNTLSLVNNTQDTRAMKER